MTSYSINIYTSMFANKLFKCAMNHICSVGAEDYLHNFTFLGNGIELFTSQSFLCIQIHSTISLNIYILIQNQNFNDLSFWIQIQGPYRWMFIATSGMSLFRTFSDFIKFCSLHQDFRIFFFEYSAQKNIAKYIFL